METGEAANAEYQPELSALRDNLVQYEIQAAHERQGHAEKRFALDRLVVTWKDLIHSYLKMLGNGDPVILHKVIDNMDEFLNRQKELYK